MNKHTQGPWRAGMSSVLVWSGKGWAKLAGHHSGAVITEKEARANLTLAAAAPELLAAAELVLKSFAYAPSGAPEWYEAARVAHAKATVGAA